MLMMENAEEILQVLERFTKLKQKEIPRELEDYLCFVAKTGDTIFRWTNIKALYREKLIGVIKQFHEQAAIDDLPQYPNVDPFNYETLKTALLERLDGFGAAPFTIQRISELLTDPRKQYARIDKYMRALEKNILVVSTVEPGRKSSSSLSSSSSSTSCSTVLNPLTDNSGDYSDSLDSMVNGSSAATLNANSSSSSNTSGGAASVVSNLTTADLNADIDVDIEMEAAATDSIKNSSSSITTTTSTTATNGSETEADLITTTTTTTLPPINTLSSAIIAATNPQRPLDEDTDEDTDEDEVHNHLPVPVPVATDQLEPAAMRASPCPQKAAEEVAGRVTEPVVEETEEEKKEQTEPSPIAEQLKQAETAIESSSVVSVTPPTESEPIQEAAKELIAAEGVPTIADPEEKCDVDEPAKKLAKLEGVKCLDGSGEVGAPARQQETCSTEKMSTTEEVKDLKEPATEAVSSAAASPAPEQDQPTKGSLDSADAQKIGDAIPEADATISTISVVSEPAVADDPIPAKESSCDTAEPIDQDDPAAEAVAVVLPSVGGAISEAEMTPLEEDPLLDDDEEMDQKKPEMMVDESIVTISPLADAATTIIPAAAAPADGMEVDGEASGGATDEPMVMEDQ